MNRIIRKAAGDTGGFLVTRETTEEKADMKSDIGRNDYVDRNGDLFPLPAPGEATQGSYGLIAERFQRRIRIAPRLTSIQVYIPALISA